MPEEGLPEHIMEPRRRARQDEGGKEEERAYYGHTQGAYGARETQDKGLTM
jgi:hypothetical protein